MKILVLFDLGRPPSPSETFSARALKEEEDKPTEADILTALRRLGHEVDTLAVFDNVVSIVEKVKTFAPDVVFNLTESFRDDRRNEPNIPALLELLKVPYTGAGPDALMLCKDKALAKELLVFHRIRVARFVVSSRKHPLRRLRRFVFPAFVKPIGEESSDGISLASLATNETEAIERARFIHERFKSDALIEEYIEGRELYIGVLGNHRLNVFPPRELLFGGTSDDSPRFATFKAKWDDDYRKRHNIKNGPAVELPLKTIDELGKLARKVYRALRIRGLGRIDVRLRANGEIVVIEANPNPSLAREDDFAQAASAAGMSYGDVIQSVLQLAIGNGA